MNIEKIPPETQKKIENMLQPNITKGDKSIRFEALFGLWKDQPRKLSNIRK